MTAMVLLSTWMESQVEFWAWTQYVGYDVSSFGDVRSWWVRVGCSTGAKWALADRPQRLLRAAHSRDGYMQVGLRTLLSERGRVVKMVHQLVALAFLPNPDSKPQVNHITTLKTDNRLDNLEWATRSRNIKHAFDNGLNKPRLGIANGMGKLTDDTVREIRRIARQPNISGRQIAAYYNITPTLVSRVILRRTYQHVE